MTIILKYQWRQFYNFWRQLGVRVQLEILILFFIFFSFFTEKLVTLFTHWLERPDITPAGLAGILVHTLLIVILFSAPFIYFNLVPKQRGLLIFASEPLSPSQVMTVLVLMYLKYQLIILLIALPILAALTISGGIWLLFYSLTVLVSFTIFAMPIIHMISAKPWTHFFKISVYFLISGIYLLLYFILYWLTGYALHFDLFMILVTGWFLRRYWRFSWISWDHLLGRARFFLEITTKQVSGINYFSFPRKIPFNWRPLVMKELLSYLRNRKYQRLKILSLALFILVLSVISLYFPDDYLVMVSLVTFLFIWEHYSHQFNEKYVSRDPAAFYKTLPLKFRHFIFSKFLSEFIFIISIVAVIFISALIHGLDISEILLLCLMILLISAVILYVIILIRLYFYDRPRFAGYAYHMLIIFMMVTTLTYYLVGPIICLGILVYLNFVSYRQFVR